jgi:signal transduction histidine kinase
MRRSADELHPSMLEHLGLAAASRSFCSDFSKRHGIEVRFGERGAPASIPREVSLFLYRVLQEALKNLANGPRRTKAAVALTGSEDEISLLVSHKGGRLGPGAMRAKGGLGLAAIRERARLVGATISIRSRPGAGTRIDVHVPLQRRKLTARQREVLQLVAEGYSAKQIAAVLNISIKTVDFHKSVIKQRLGVSGIAELTRFAIEQGILGR